MAEPQASYPLLHRNNSEQTLRDAEDSTPLEQPTRAFVPAWRRKPTRKWKWVLGGLLSFLILLLGIQLLVFSSDTDDDDHPSRVVPGESQLTCATPNPVIDFPWLYPSSSLNFEHPTMLARDNLRNDTYYVTTFAQAGFTNQFISFLHLIYLGQLTGRVPIIPPIVAAAHMPETAGTLNFSTVYNLTNLRSHLRSPILEWTDIKALPPNASATTFLSPSDPALEHFGCWTTRPRAAQSASWVRSAENVLKLDIAFTRIPTLAFFDPKNAEDPHLTFYGLAAAITPGRRHRDAEEDRLEVWQESRMGQRVKPDERVSCFDSVYYVSTGVREFEFEERWSPAWVKVGRWLRFTREMEDIASGYLRVVLGLDEEDEIPKMITVHIRRGDFGVMCKMDETPPCFIPLETYRDAVEEVKQEVFKKHGVEIQTVLVASNEEDPAFWKTLREEYNWSYLNHTALRTVEEHGEWYPVLVDKVVLSMGLGFVGTNPSTFSVFNARRVEDWNGGVTRLLSH